MLFDEDVPLAGAIGPREPLSLELATPDVRDALLPAVLGDAAPSLTIGDFFDRRGYSRVAGKAALTPLGDSPEDTSAAAAHAGAVAVVLHGAEIPSGSLGLDERIAVPVVSIPERVAEAAQELIRQKEPATIEIGTPRGQENPSRDGPAAFSSRGLAFSGGLKPELYAPGVALLTSHPGRAANGQPAYGTVSGSSAVRRDRRRRERASRAGPSRPRRGRPQGRADRHRRPGRPARPRRRRPPSEVVAEPATLALGYATGRGWSRTAHFSVRNLSSRALRVDVSVGRLGEVGGIALVASPSRVTLAPGEARKISLAGRLAYIPPGVREITAALELRAGGGAPVRVPWTVILGQPPRDLLGGVRLSVDRFRPSDSAPALLELRAGRLIDRNGVAEVLPLSHLDLDLWRGKERLGRLARLRNLLPGRYTFGLTGRGPAGRRLRPGMYQLRLIAYPPGKVPPSREVVTFRIK